MDGALKVNVIDFINDPSRPAVFYRIEITKGGDSWIVEKRFSEFELLRNTLKKKVSGLPSLPGKTFFKPKNDDDLRKRMNDLNKWVGEILVRNDVFSSNELRNFLQLDTMAPETNYMKPILLGEIEELVFGVQSFKYIPEKGVLFMAIHDMSAASRFDSYATNFKFPWEKELGTHVTVGAVEVWKRKSNDTWEFEKLWTKSYPCLMASIFWNEDLTMLTVGLDNGKVSCLRVSTELNYMQYDEYCTLENHASKVTGVATDASAGMVHSVSHDKHYKIIDINQQEVVSDVVVGTAPLSCLILDEYKRAFVSNNAGVVFIYDVAVYPARVLHSVQSTGKSEIRNLVLDFNRSYMFSSGFDGSLGVFELGKPTKERFTKQVANFIGKPKIRGLAWSPSANELYAGDDNGFLHVWNTVKGAPIFVHQCFSKHAITDLHWIESEKVLLTSSKEKSFKIWRLPEKWHEKEGVEELVHGAGQLLLGKGLQSAMTMGEKEIPAYVRPEDSDDDDLLGWHRS